MSDLILDGVTFAVLRPDDEVASVAGVLIGELWLHEETGDWHASFGDELPVTLRSRAEARAYIVGMHRKSWAGMWAAPYEGGR